jgi:hypothetical protein
MTAASSKRQNFFRRLSLIIGLVLTAWWMLGGISIVVGFGEEMTFMDILPHIALGLTFIVSIAVAWRQETMGGVLLVVEGVFAALSSPIIAYHCEEMTIVSLLLMISLPLLLSGALFILSH